MPDILYKYLKFRYECKLISQKRKTKDKGIAINLHVRKTEYDKTNVDHPDDNSDDHIDQNHVIKIIIMMRNNNDCFQKDNNDKNNNNDCFQKADF